MRNKQFCSKCKRLEGYSAFRNWCMQCGATVSCLYSIVNSKAATDREQNKARDTLQRYGFNPDRRCILTSVADKFLVRIPRAPHMTEVFPCVDYRDKMHGMMIFFHRMIMTALNQILWNSQPGIRVKEILDQRLVELGNRGTLRDPQGRSYRIQKSMFTDVNMSATDKVCVVFLLPHVFGHQSLIIPVDVRKAMTTTIVYAQMMLIAARGRREYTMVELRQIFDEGYVEMFMGLEHVFQIHHQRTYAKRLAKHSRNPDKNPGVSTPSF